MGTNRPNSNFSHLIDTNYYKFASWVFPDVFHHVQAHGGAGTANNRVSMLHTTISKSLQL